MGALALDHLGFLSTQMTESPLRNILGMNLLLLTGAPFFPLRGISVQTSWTFSITMFMCLSKAFTFPSNFLLLRKAMSTSLLAFTDFVSREKGPTLKFYYCSCLRYCYISTLIIISPDNYHHPLKSRLDRHCRQHQRVRIEVYVLFPSYVQSLIFELFLQYFQIFPILLAHLPQIVLRPYPKIPLQIDQQARIAQIVQFSVHSSQETRLLPPNTLPNVQNIGNVVTGALDLVLHPQNTPLFIHHLVELPSTGRYLNCFPGLLRMNARATVQRRPPTVGNPQRRTVILTRGRRSQLRPLLCTFLTFFRRIPRQDSNRTPFGKIYAPVYNLGLFECVELHNRQQQIQWLCFQQDLISTMIQAQYYYHNRYISLKPILSYNLYTLIRMPNTFSRNYSVLFQSQQQSLYIQLYLD